MRGHVGFEQVGGEEHSEHAHELVVVRSGKTPFLTPRDLVQDVLGLGEHLLKQVSSRATAGVEQLEACLLYTSDAADERSSVDLGGRRIIKKKQH